MAHDVRRLRDGSIDYDAYRQAAARLRRAARTAMLRRLSAALFGRRMDTVPAQRQSNKFLDVGLLLSKLFSFRSTKGRSHETS